MKLIIGLGNPGKEYEGTRHNVGFRILDALANTVHGTRYTEQVKFKSEMAEIRLGSEKVILAKPMTFMNASGEAVQALKSFYKLSIDQVLVIHDEMDYPPGVFAFVVGSGSAGHNGVESVQQESGTKNIARLRIGIGRPTVGTKEDFVLTKFSTEEESIIRSREADLVQAVKDWVTSGLDKAMNTWNGVKGA